MASKKSRKTASRSPTARASSRQGPTGRRNEAYRPSTSEPADMHEILTPTEHYRREKARRAAERAGAAAADPLEEARREYRAMLAADAAKQKGGRPKKSAARPAEADEQEDADGVQLEDASEADGPAPEREDEEGASP